jgi:hypothetical protein
VQYALLDAEGRPGELHRTETRNLGVGGAFVVTETPPPVGTRLLLRLGAGLPDVEGEVRWVAQPPHERGIGVRFVPMSPADLLALVSFLGPVTDDPTGAERR